MENKAMTNKSVFHISKMDCSSEEQLIKMKLESLDEIKSLQFNLPKRKLTAYHNGEVEPILHALENLNLNTKLISTAQSEMLLENETQEKERKLLWTVFLACRNFPNRTKWNV